MAPVAMVVGAVATVVGTVKSAQARQQQVRLQERQQTVATRRSRRQAVRQMQLQRASAVAGSVGAGSFGGSGSFGGIGSLGSQLGEQMGFSTQMSGISSGINMAQRKAVTWDTIGQLGQMAFNYGSANYIPGQPAGNPDGPSMGGGGK